MVTFDVKQKNSSNAKGFLGRTNIVCYVSKRQCMTNYNKFDKVNDM